MRPYIRRALPDNLDPLVDTLSNVVGILVIVVALTQIQLGDALTRVVELDRLRASAERTRAAMPEEIEQLGTRRDALLRRTETDVEGAAVLARKTLDALAQWPAVASAIASEPLDALRKRGAAAQQTLDQSRDRRDREARYAERLETVPKRLVARLPNPTVVQGKESWIIVRYGRIYLAEREELFTQAERAIVRILGSVTDGRGTPRAIRPDEYSTVSLYLRKRDVGDGLFRWQMRTDPPVRVELDWRSREAGIAASEFATDANLRAWLSRRSPELDFIRFHVWGDSFEAYLRAREAIESAGFRGGWVAHETDEEFALPLRIGRPDPAIGPIVVD